MTDAEREDAIEQAYQDMLNACMPSERMAMNARRCELISGRSPEQVAKLEADGTTDA